MTDYEAVYESVMRYARIPATDIDTQDKLARYLRENDVKNRMTDKLIDRLVSTRKAERDIERSATDRGTEPVNRERAAAFRENRRNLDREQTLARSNGFRVKGSVTDGRGVVHAVFNERDGKAIYYDAAAKRAREVRVLPSGEYRATGRFAKTPKMYDRNR